MRKEKDRGRRRLSTPIILLIILLSVTVILCCTALGLWLHGRNTLTKTNTEPTLSGDSGIQDGNYIIEYGGKYYRYNQNMCNILLMGIDAYTEIPTASGEAMEPHQADVLLLAALDLKDHRMSLISIPRDTMCNMEVLDKDGNSLGSYYGQLALAYSYGTTLRQCCDLSRNSVSGILGGIPIQGCAAYYLSGIPVLNDAVGGVTVTVLDDYPFSRMPGCGNMKAGKTVRLNGTQAQFYIQARLEDRVDSNLLRMQRQKQYLLAAISQTLQTLKAQPYQVLSIYDSVKKYVVTDLDASRIAYLAGEAVSMEFSGDITTITGELSLGEGHHAELVPDRKALTDLIINVFYEEVPAPEDSSAG